MYLGYYYYGSTYILVLIGFLLCMLASAWVGSALKKYGKIRNASGMTGAMAAERILQAEGIYDVRVECLRDNRGDHYDPSSNTVRLSNQNYNQASIAAVAVAAHECGHAKQHVEGYAPLRLRSAIVPVANFGSRFAIPLIILGVLLSYNHWLIQAGIVIFAVAVVLQIVNLPVEFNASKRALQTVEKYGILGTQEINGGRAVLRAAAFTYVAGTASAILQLLRLVMLFGGGRRRND